MYGRCRSYHKIYHMYHMLHWQMVFFCNKTNFFQRFVDLRKSVHMIIIIFSYYLYICHVSVFTWKKLIYTHDFWGFERWLVGVLYIMYFLKAWILIYRLFKRNVSADTFFFLLKFISNFSDFDDNWGLTTERMNSQNI